MTHDPNPSAAWYFLAYEITEPGLFGGAETGSCVFSADPSKEPIEMYRAKKEELLSEHPAKSTFIATAFNRL